MGKGPQFVWDKGDRSEPSKLPENIVPHPRFGVMYRPDVKVPADLSRQNFTAYSIPYYVDILGKCRNGGRPFIFFAIEQKYWYEDLRFNIHSCRCVRCAECRRSKHHLRESLRQYSQLVGRDDLSDPELETLVNDAAFLYSTGLLEDESRLRRIKNLALARIPDSPATKQILDVIAEIPEVDGQRLGGAEAAMLRGIVRLIDAGASIVTDKQAKATIIPPDNLDLEAIPSFTKAFGRLLGRGLVTRAQDRFGAWGVRPTPAAVEGLRGGSDNV